MDNQNNDKQGRGNTIFNINHVENLINGDVETLNNTHNEGEVKKSKPSSDDNVNKGNRLQRQMEIMQYVSNLKEFVAKKWQSRYDDLWKPFWKIQRLHALYTTRANSKTLPLIANL